MYNTRNMMDLKLIALISILIASSLQEQPLAVSNQSDGFQQEETVSSVEIIQLRSDVQMLFESTKQLKDVANKQGETIAYQGETIAYQGETITSQSQTITNQNQTIAFLEKEVNRLNQKFEAASTAAAFSAYASTEADYGDGTIVVFDTVVTNIGEYYSTDASIFVCPVEGLYLFSLSVNSDPDNSMTGYIVKGGDTLLRAASGSGTYNQGSSTVLTDCLPSQGVWVECNGDNRRIASGPPSSFSGVLIMPYV